MRRIVYAGSVFYTGDALAEALLEYARALARHGIADTVFVPARTAQGEAGTVEVLIGPASQIISERAEIIGPEVEEPGLVARLRELTAQFAPRRPAAEPADGEDGTSASAVGPSFDELG